MFISPTYDRTEGLYRVVLPTTGELFFSQTRTEAEWAYLGAIAPELVTKAQRIAWTNPLLEDHLRKACFVVLEGEIAPCHEPLGGSSSLIRVARVCCQRYSEHTYQITVWENKYFCDCPDALGQDTDYGRRLARAHRSKVAEHTCKHILAYVLSGV